jgi:hypothetical protein
MRQIARATRNQTRRVAEAKESEGRGRAIKLIYRFFAPPFSLFLFLSAINTKEERRGGENDVAVWLGGGWGWVGGTYGVGFFKLPPTLFLDLHSRRHQKSFSFPHWGIYTCAVLFFPLQLLSSFFGWCFASTQTVTTNRKGWWWFFFCSIDMMST